MKRMRSLGLPGAVLVVAMSFAKSAPAVEADAAVRAFVDRINATTGSASSGTIRSACGKLIAQAFDIDTLAVSASYDTWKRMNQSQKSAYRQALVDRATGDCAKRGKEVAGHKVEIIGVRPGKGNVRQVAVQRADGQGKVAVWKVVPAGGGVLAIDVVVDGHSLVASARNQARQILQDTDGNINALIKAVGN